MNEENLLKKCTLIILIKIKSQFHISGKFCVRIELCRDIRSNYSKSTNQQYDELLLFPRDATWPCSSKFS